MNWNAFNLISPAIGKTKKRISPFKFKEWLNLAIISSLAKTGSNFTSFNYGSDISSGSVNQNFSEAFREGIKKYWVIGGIIFFILFALISVINYIQSVFSFIFIENLVENKKAKYTFKKNNSKGVSLFLFNFIFSVISLILIAALASPYVYYLMKSEPVIASIGIPYLLFSIFAFVVYFLFLSLLFLIISDFVVPYMYKKEVSVSVGLKQIWKAISKHKKESFVYLVSKIVLGFVVGFMVLIFFVIALIALVLVALIFFLIGLLIFKLVGGLGILVFLGILIALILIIILIVLVFIAVMPFSVFLEYFALMNFEKLTKLKIINF
ncbi:MAG: hypothetical protein Q7S33_02635 [Nanoarchaeota archaeon]|nr:hypothetical protein [Nanoarchaeota archaeon]